MVQLVVTACDPCHSEDRITLGDDYRVTIEGKGVREETNISFCEEDFDKFVSWLKEHGKRPLVAPVAPAPPPVEHKPPTPIEPVAPEVKPDPPKCVPPPGDPVFWELMAVHREKRGLTFAELSKRTGIPTSTITVARTRQSLNSQRKLIIARELGFEWPPKAEGEKRKENEYPYASFYDYVEQTCKEKGWTVEQFADKTSLSPSTIERLKTRLPRGITLQMIATALGVKLERAVKVYAELKKRGSPETESLNLEPESSKKRDYPSTKWKATCGECGWDIKLNNRGYHARNNHGKEPNTINWAYPKGMEHHMCDDCGLPQPTRDSLVRHRATLHSVTKKAS